MKWYFFTTLFVPKIWTAVDVVSSALMASTAASMYLASSINEETSTTDPVARHHPGPHLLRLLLGRFGARLLIREIHLLLRKILGKRYDFIPRDLA